MVDEGLVQFLVLAKTAKGAACVALIQQVLSNKRIFTFGELLAMPNVQALTGTPHEPHLRLLEIFAYGTHADYRSKATELPALTDAQGDKLRMLSMVSLAHKHKAVPYDLMKTELDVDNVRRLEDMIFDTIYSGLLQGKLDQRQEILKVKYAIARDVRVESIGDMVDKLGRWASATRVLLSTLEGSVDEAAEAREKERARNNRVEEEAERVQKVLKETLGKMRDEDPYHDIGYDMDTDRSSIRRGRSKRNRSSGFGNFRQRNK